MGFLAISLLTIAGCSKVIEIDSDDADQYIKNGEIKKIVIVKEGDFTFCEAYITQEARSYPPHTKLKQRGYYQFDIHDASDAKSHMEAIAKSSLGSSLKLSDGNNFTITSINKQPSMWDGIFSYGLLIVSPFFFVFLLLVN